MVTVSEDDNHRNHAETEFSITNHNRNSVDLFAILCAICVSQYYVETQHKYGNLIIKVISSLKEPKINQAISDSFTGRPVTCAL